MLDTLRSPQVIVDLKYKATVRKCEEDACDIDIFKVCISIIVVQAVILIAASATLCVYFSRQ